MPHPLWQPSSILHVISDMSTEGALAGHLQDTGSLWVYLMKEIWGEGGSPTATG